MHSNGTDLNGLIGDVLRLGTIETVDLATGHATVKCGEVISPPLRWFEHAGGYSTWCPPTEGEQVMILAPEGDIAAAVILRGIYSDAFAPPATGNRWRFKTPDNSTFDYDPESHELTITLTGGKAKLIAPEGFEIEGDVKVTGKIEATGNIETPEDVKAGAISLKGHKHSGVQAGAAKTAVPE